jgi:excinuclease UvrABC helicase subunit UvrB
MEDFNFNGMSDDEFKKEFMRFLNYYQDSMKEFMRGPFGYDDFIKLNTNNENPYENLFKNISNEDMDIQKGSDQHGEWEKRSWSSPDGKKQFTSFTRNSGFNPKNNTFMDNVDSIDTLTLLKNKLNKAVINEDYEDAAKIRDLIKSLEK